MIVGEVAAPTQCFDPSGLAAVVAEKYMMKEPSS